MEFRIASSFQDSLQKLTNTEQTAAKSTVYDLQANPANPGLQFHRLDKPKDPNFWSVRSNQDIRVIVHRLDSSFLVCYVDHHDKAYKWAENRKLEVHPATGAAQIVEIRETVKEIVIPKYVEAEMPKRPIFENWDRDRLLQFGVPEEWIDDVLSVTSEDQLLELVDHLPDEAANALLIIFDGGVPEVSIAEEKTPFDHPDALRRFRVMKDVDELKAALEFPWEKWAIYLHPAQREIVEKNYSGPARVSGSAGTGKTIVALHRAVNLARQNPDSRILLTTFSPTLADNLRNKLRVLISAEPRLAERIDVHAIHSIARRLYELKFGKPKIVSETELGALIKVASEAVDGHKFSQSFLRAEWDQIVDAWQIKDWEGYRDVVRLGRKTRLPEKQRESAWKIFECLKARLSEEGLVTHAMIFDRLTADLEGGAPAPYDFVVVDEAQDLTPTQLRFLSALARTRANGLFFAGDLGQRIFQQAFSWLSLGVDIRGRSRSLKINYRTSHQIRSHADRLLGPEVADVDGIVEDRRGTISIFNSADPEIKTFNSVEGEIAGVGEWISRLTNEGVLPTEIAVFVRSEDELERAASAVAGSGLQHTILDSSIEPADGSVSIGTMHLAKGLEFRAVAVVACDDEIVPLQARIETVAEESDLEEVYNTERHLLYVACTRARDHLLVTSGDVPSEFLADLNSLETPPIKMH
ncbi:MAG TPA: UvrD-helicase domain-containing protein [Pyrinomonadaceae bacterium]|nr:UvrD-helicase domain-containing protein [Pyrinomonadaceae bacterium]